MLWAVYAHRQWRLAPFCPSEPAATAQHSQPNKRSLRHCNKFLYLRNSVINLATKTTRSHPFGLFSTGSCDVVGLLKWPTNSRRPYTEYSCTVENIPSEYIARFFDNASEIFIWIGSRSALKKKRTNYVISDRTRPIINLENGGVIKSHDEWGFRRGRVVLIAPRSDFKWIY